MAKLQTLFSTTQIKRLARTVDFYYRNGVPVVRSWPKKSNLVATPAQRVQRDNFRAIECWLKSQGPEQRAAWRRWQPPRGQTWVDYVHRVLMPAASNNVLHHIPDIESYSAARQPFTGITAIDVVFSSPLSPPDVKLAAAYAPTSEDLRPWPFHLIGYRPDRGRNVRPVYGPPQSGIRIGTSWPVIDTPTRRFFLCPGMTRFVGFCLVPLDPTLPSAHLSPCYTLENPWPWPS